MHFRKSNVYHRIESLKNDVVTLFIAWERKDKRWNLKTHEKVVAPESYICPDRKGVYQVNINGVLKLALFDEYWRIGKDGAGEALVQTKPSIHQVVEFLKI